MGAFLAVGLHVCAQSLYFVVLCIMLCMGTESSECCKVLHLANMFCLYLELYKPITLLSMCWLFDTLPTHPYLAPLTFDLSAFTINL